MVAGLFNFLSIRPPDLMLILKQIGELISQEKL